MHAGGHACVHTCYMLQCFDVFHVQKYCTNVLVFLSQQSYVDYRYAVFFFNGACRGKVEITIS